MTTRRLLLFAVSTFLSLFPSLRAAEPKLTVGDPAPPLAVSEFIQGEPVKELETGKAYLIDFWATWCGPCVASIPHIEYLYERYKDQGLVVIGQNVWERDPRKVGTFMAKMAERLTFRVALDAGGKMGKTWLKAAGENGIPTAFLVGKDGKIAWIDHPEVLTETVIDQVLAGSFDVALERRLRESRGKISESYYKAFASLQTAIKDRKWADAQAAVESMKSIMPAEDVPWVRVVETQQFKLLVAKGESDEAIKLGESIVGAEKENTTLANSIALVVGRAENPTGALLKFGEASARRANAAARGRNPRFLENLARLLFRQGRRDEAIHFQQRAIDSAVDEDDLQRLRAALAAYKSGKLPE